jgi:hypothetical protein
MDRGKIAHPAGQNTPFCSYFLRVSDGIRTRDRRDHNPELYQLSYAHQGHPI